MSETEVTPKPAANRGWLAWVLLVLWLSWIAYLAWTSSPYWGKPPGGANPDPDTQETTRS